MTGDNIPNTNYGKPEGDEGREILERMNQHHAGLWDWCMQRMPRSMDGAVLDVGCGGGGFLKSLSERYPYAMFFGADISADALGMTLENNRELDSSGGLELHEASVDDLPFDDGSFDLVTAMETYFFWPDLEAALKELFRVVSAGGLLVIGSEMQLRDDNADVAEESLRLYGARLRRDEEIVSMMEAAGFDVMSYDEPSEDWVVFVGSKPL